MAEISPCAHRAHKEAKGKRMGEEKEKRELGREREMGEGEAGEAFLLHLIRL